MTPDRAPSDDLAATTESLRLEAPEIGRRISRGAILLTYRSIAIRGISAIGNIVLARLLSPGDFGLIAVGGALVAFMTVLADGGLGAALIRGDHWPTRLVYEQLVGFQLAIALVANLLVVGVAFVVGRPGWIVAVMASAFLVAVFQTPGEIYLERNLLFRRVAVIDFVQVLAYVIWALGAAALGAGVWALATASVVQTLVAVAVTLLLSPVRILRPRLGMGEIRPLLPFGVRFQAIGVVNLIRDQGLNVGIAAIAGVNTLGVWTMAYRFIQIPFILFESLWRVTMPGMARLIEASADPRPLTRTILERSAALTGAILCVVGGTCPALVATLFDHRWHAITAILPWAFGGLVAAGPISVAVGGLLFAYGDAGIVLRSAVAHSITLLLLALTLLPLIGVTALGIGTFASTVVEGAVLGTRASRTYDIRIIRPVAAPTLASFAGGACAWIVSERIHPPILAAAGGAGVGLIVFTLILQLTDRRVLQDTLKMIYRHARVGRGSSR
jgi:O-antigen/teichoic acid export membrane protein